VTLSDQYLNESLTHTKQSPSPFLLGTNIQYAWDSTSLGLLKTCPRLYQYTMIDGWASPDESVHLRFGIEYHAALELFDRLLAEGNSRETAIREMVRAILVSTVEFHPDQDTKAGKYKNRKSLLQLALDYVDHFDPDPATTYLKTDGAPAVELSFSFPVDFGPQTQLRPVHERDWDAADAAEENNSRAQPYLLCGHLDRVVSFNRQLFVMDRKTTTTTLGPYYFSQYEPHNQMTLYTLAGRIILEAPIAGVIIDAAQIKLEEPNAFARGFTHRTEAQLNEWLDDLSLTLSIAEQYATQDYWPMNDISCDKYGGCRFRGICTRDPHVRYNFLKSDFVQQERDQRWNPLRSR
jgi:hypothetical protein